MILTEREGKEKACCDGGYGAVVRADDEGKYDCIASKCMAWRYAIDADGRPSMKRVGPAFDCKSCGGTGAIPDPPDGDPVPCADCDGDGKIGNFERTGYCGLAGEPESTA